MDPNVAFWVPSGATFLLGVAGIWISIRMARISSTLANLTEEAKSINATLDRIENKHFDLTKELATRNEYRRFRHSCGWVIPRLFFGADLD